MSKNKAVSGESSDESVSPKSAQRTFGWRGWVLLCGIILALVIIPGIIAFFPPTDLSYRFAFLILPLIPAVGLAVLAVWATTRP